MSIKNLSSSPAIWNTVGDSNIKNTEPYVALDLSNGFASTVKLGLSSSKLGGLKVLRIGSISANTISNISSFTAGPVPQYLKPLGDVTIPMYVTSNTVPVVVYCHIANSGIITFYFPTTIPSGSAFLNGESTIIYV